MTLALGRIAAAERRETPAFGRASSWRQIPPEPDELWDALLLYDELARLDEVLKTAVGARLQGLAQLRSKKRAGFALLLERMAITGKDLATVSRDLAPVVTALNLAPVGEDELGTERTAAHRDALVVTLKGKGFGHEATRAVRVEIVNAAGSQRVVHLAEARHTLDMELVEWAAAAPLSAYGAAAGSGVAIILDVTLRSGRRAVRCVDRFILG